MSAVLLDPIYLKRHDKADYLLGVLRSSALVWSEPTQWAMKNYLCGHITPRLLNASATELMTYCAPERMAAPHSWKPKPRGPDIGVWSAPLLMWGLTQPWSSSIDISAFRKNWCDALHAAQLHYPVHKDALVLLAGVHYLEQHHSISVSQRMYAELFEACREFIPWSRLHHIESDGNERQACAETMGLTAVRGGEKTKDIWLGYLKEMTHQEPQAAYYAILDVLNSELPDDFKLDAALKGSYQHWTNSYMQAYLEVLLPSEESERCSCLPLVASTRLVRSMGTPSTMKTVNEHLMQAYCPELHTLLATVAGPEEWGDPTWLLDIARKTSTSFEPVELPASLMEEGHPW